VNLTTGKMIKEKRRFLKQTAITLSKSLGYGTPSFVLQIESGYKPPLEKLPEIASSLKMTREERANLYRSYIKEFHPVIYKMAKVAFGISTNNGGGKPKVKIKVQTKPRMIHVVRRNRG